jgi:nanoRNase/pAp phosphatase (c-di-AMP/oligoRNAs hydrolase)
MTYRPSFWKRYKLKKLLSQKKKLAIFIGRNPSPDDLASAFALKRIADHYHVDGKIVYTGIIHNKALANVIGSDAEDLTSESFDNATIALVNLLPTSSNGVMEEIGGRDVEIIIGHSTSSVRNIKCGFKDIRREVGNSTTIMTGYLKSMGIAIDKRLATLLFYALREATHMLVANVTEKDLQTYSFIHKYIDQNLLTRLEHPSVKSETFTDLALAIKNKVIKDAYLFTSIGYTKDATTLPRVCRYMLDLEGVSTALALVVNDTKVYLYAESKNLAINIKNVLSKIITKGEISAEASYGTAIAPLGVFGAITDEESRKILIASIEDNVSSRYFEVLEEEG